MVVTVQVDVRQRHGEARIQTARFRPPRGPGTIGCEGRREFSSAGGVRDEAHGVVTGQADRVHLRQENVGVGARGPLHRDRRVTVLGHGHGRRNGAGHRHPKVEMARRVRDGGESPRYSPSVISTRAPLTGRNSASRRKPETLMRTAPGGKPVPDAVAVGDVGPSHPAHHTALPSNASTVHTRVCVGIGRSISESAVFYASARESGPPYLNHAPCAVV